MAKVCPPECLQIVLSGGCCFPLRIDEDTVANDQRVLAHVSCEEARTYIRGVNVHIANGTKKVRAQISACFVCIVLGVVLYGVGLSVFVEEKRLRCEGPLCKRGEDPLVDKCCIFWCCGNEMRASPVRARRLRAKSPEAHPEGHKLKTRPYDRWDVWANETYFGITERCSLYDEKPPDDHTKRDAKYDCTSCPASLLDEEDENKVGCRTMFEGKATEHEVWWPFLFIAVWALPIFVLVPLLCALASAHHRLYAEAFSDWRTRGVGACVELNFRRPTPSTAIRRAMAYNPLVDFHTGRLLRAIRAKPEQGWSPWTKRKDSELPAALFPGRASGRAGGHWHGGPRGSGFRKALRRRPTYHVFVRSSRLNKFSFPSSLATALPKALHIYTQHALATRNKKYRLISNMLLRHGASRAPRREARLHGRAAAQPQLVHRAARDREDARVSRERVRAAAVEQ